MNALAALLILAGCSPEPTIGPKLVWKLTGLGEGSVPFQFALLVKNEGDADAIVDAVTLHVVRKTLISRTGDRDLPPDFDYEVRLIDDQGRPVNAAVVPPVKTRRVPGVLEWRLPPEPPPMVAVVKVEFVGENEGREVLRSAPITVVLESTPGVLDDMVETSDNVQQAAETLRVLSNFEAEAELRGVG